jgi:hypothetical protein
MSLSARDASNCTGPRTVATCPQLAARPESPALNPAPFVERTATMEMQSRARRRAFLSQYEPRIRVIRSLAVVDPVIR